MALFLNRIKLNFWISKLIEEAEKEIVIIVPYIKISENTFKSLSKADRNNIEIVIIYRENKLNQHEKAKLQELKNVTLMHHPNIHAKSYFNGDLLIIGSMNLYDFSEKNNREMGVLFHRKEINSKFYEGRNQPISDDIGIFDDAIEEMQDIINGSVLEKSGVVTAKENFNIEIIQTKEEIEIERSHRITKNFRNKKFRSYRHEGNIWYSKCANYFENIDVVFETHRLHVKINLSDNELRELYKKWMRQYDEFEFNNIKYYWNHPSKEILIYKDLSSNEWKQCEKNEPETHRLLESGINDIIRKFRTLTGK